MSSKTRTLSLTKQKARSGRLFVLPFTLGFVFFFLQPLVMSLYYSFSNLSMGVSGFDVKLTGIQNYVFAFVKDADFPPLLATTFQNMCMQAPVILLFSLFIAVILNQRFKGRMLARAVFFLPVIVTSGIIIAIMKQDVLGDSIKMGDAQSAYLFKGSGLLDIMVSLKIPISLINGFMDIVNSIFDMLWKSGVQILLFLAALQGIPGQLYEASKIEGATAWESFWKITFPMISPLIVVNLVYTIIDSFTDYNNSLMLSIQQMAFNQMRYAYAYRYIFIS